MERWLPFSKDLSMIGIVGEPQCGKSALLNLLLAGDEARRGQREWEASVGVPDPRLNWLTRHYEPRKSTPARLEFSDVGGDPRHAGVDLAALLNVAELRNCEGLALVLDGFSRPVDVGEVQDFELATAVADLDLVERRLERLAADRKRGLKEADSEIRTMEREHSS